MPRNIIERAIIPNNPSSNKVIHNNQYYLYAPVGGVNKVGMAGFDGSQFDVSNEQIVSVKTSFVNEIVDLTLDTVFDMTDATMDLSSTRLFISIKTKC